MFDLATWSAVPFHCWSVVVFVFGAMVGSFLNVCIYRMPRGESIVSPPSHCPHCGYAIPWYLNVPLVTWLWLRARCAHCGAPISARYFLVELLTSLTFLFTWLAFGPNQPAVAVVFCVLLAGFIVATYIDLEHFIIPDEITLGGIGAGVLLSCFVPGMHGRITARDALMDSFWGIAVGAGVVYGIVRGGKLLFGRQKIELQPDTMVVFTEDTLVLPDEEIPYADLFYRQSDRIELRARRLELPDRCYWEVPVRLSPTLLQIGNEKWDPATVPHLEAVTSQLTVPREAMGLGDVKFMAAIGAFLGWKGVMFSLTASSIIGALTGVVLIALNKREWSSRLPYGPFIALAAVLWMFQGPAIVRRLFGI